MGGAACIFEGGPNERDCCSLSESDVGFPRTPASSARSAVDGDYSPRISAGDSHDESLALSDSDIGGQLNAPGCSRSSRGSDIWPELLPAVGMFARKMIARPLPNWHETPPLHMTLVQKGDGRGWQGSKPIGVGEEYVVRYYGTPRCFRCSHVTSAVLTERSCGDLPAQLYFDSSVAYSSDHRCASPEFVEWLMGVPRAWTSPEPIPAAALAAHPVRGLCPQQTPRRRVASLFSGCGALDFGLSPWLEPAVYCERDDDAVRVLEARMSDGSLPRGSVHRDVRQLVRGDVPTCVEGIVGGRPVPGFLAGWA